MAESLKLLTKRGVSEIVGVHEQTIMRLVREGKFPQPLRTGNVGSAVRWRAQDVAAWINLRLSDGSNSRPKPKGRQT
jgi:prophage regulatory protein